MINLEDFEYMFLSSFLFAEYQELKGWKELSKIAENLPLNYFTKNTPAYFLLRLLKKLQKDYDNLLPTSSIVLNYIKEVENKQLQDLLDIAFIEAGQKAPVPAEVLKLYLPTFEQKVLLKQTRGLV